MKSGPTIKDIARAVGVTPATVSYVLNQNPKQSISAQTRERVMKAAQEMGYVPSSAAKVVHGSPSYCVGVATFELSVTVPIKVDGEEYDWWNVFDAKVVIYPISGNGNRVAFTGCCVQEVGDQYETEGEAKRDLKLFAVERVEE